MDGNLDGTPNPLNPVSGNAGGAPVQKSAMPEIPTAAPVSAMPEIPVARPAARPNNHGAIDPMMRSVPRHDESSNAQPEQTVEETFDALTMDDNSLDMVSQEVSAGPSRAEVIQTESISTDLGGFNEPNLVAKDSIVESADKKGGKKKGFLIAVIILLVVALGCGAAAAAIMLMGGKDGDRVTKAIEKVLNDEMPATISAQGSIKTSAETADSYVNSNYASATDITIDFDGTFDTASSTNKISASVDLDFGSVDIPLDIEEITTSGNTYFRLSGLSNVLRKIGAGQETTETSVKCSDDATKCLDIQTDCSDEDCIEPVVVGSPLSILSSFSGLLEAADNTWILISDDFEDSMEGLDVFDNTSTCLINAFSTLPKYSKDILDKYKANPFITSTTENLGISRKKDALYKLSFDHDKMSAFSNSLGNNGFINELNACTGGKASNSGTTATMIEEIFDNFPTLYVEVDDDNNFTRFYFETTITESGMASSTTADINLSYPKDFKVSEPNEYITMSQLLNNVFSSLFTDI